MTGCTDGTARGPTVSEGTDSQGTDKGLEGRFDRVGPRKERRGGRYRGRGPGVQPNGRGGRKVEGTSFEGRPDPEGGQRGCRWRPASLGMGDLRPPPDLRGGTK